MLENWLHPVKPEDILNQPLSEYQLGSRLTFFENSSPDLKKVQVAIIGVGTMESNAVRQALYPLVYSFDGLGIADLGNLRKKEIEFAIPFLMELVDSRIFPIIIGSDPFLLQAQYKAFQHSKEWLNLVVVDECIPLGADTDDTQQYLNEIIYGKRTKLHHVGIIGCQNHFTAPNVFTLFENRFFDWVRLGKAKADMAEVEPIVRNGDIMAMHLGALKQSEAPGVWAPSPSGFTVEEACQLARYGGMSEKLKSFGLYGMKGGKELNRQTAQAAAQIIWYFIEGLFHRKNDYPATTDGLVEYIVDFKNPDWQITFWKSQRSGRWWMQVPGKTQKKFQRHQLVPCSYNDYKLACQEELPDRLLNAIRRISV